MMHENDLKQWINSTPEDPALAKELAALAEGQNEEELHDRFYRGLAFGTGGLRGVLGAGTNRMNVYTVAQATQGLAAYVIKSGLPKKVAIAYDSRINSDVFAMQAARVMAANGIEALVYPALAPTPALSFAVRRHGCGTGICVTASHNPAKYNGYKVYGADGCQITDDAAEAIQKEIAAVDIFEGVKRIGLEEGLENGTIKHIPQTTKDEYLNAVLALRVDDAANDTLTVVYSPLNGTGLNWVVPVMLATGVKEENITVVPQQKEPDGNFPTCPYPNPEEPEAMQLGLALCKEKGADILLATDPDSDRVGVAAKNDEGEYTLLTGNEIGVLLLDYVCKMRVKNGTMPQNPLAVKTIVTTQMANAVAAGYGTEITDVLTGFKYIGEVIGRLEKDGQANRFVFGFEESCGYISGTHVRDKDAVNACMLICDMAQHYKAEGLSLVQAMQKLYQKHGYYVTGLKSYAFEGEKGFGEMQALMQKLRQSPPAEIAGMQVEKKLDYKWENPEQAQVQGLPSSNVLQYFLQGGGLVTVRPSGTEPKIKFYYSFAGKTPEKAQSGLEKMQASFAEQLGL